MVRSRHWWISSAFSYIQNFSWCSKFNFVVNLNKLLHVPHRTQKSIEEKTILLYRAANSICDVSTSSMYLSKNKKRFFFGFEKKEKVGNLVKHLIGKWDWRKWFFFGNWMRKCRNWLIDVTWRSIDGNFSINPQNWSHAINRLTQQPPISKPHAIKSSINGN